MTLLTAPLTEALTHLETHLGLVSSSLAKAEPGLERAFRTAAIKSFEYTYALALKAIERTMAERAAQPETVEQAQFRALLRMAWEQGLIQDRDRWLEFREMRNITAHTYDADKAAQILAGLPMFITAVHHLLVKLKEPADVA